MRRFPFRILRNNMLLNDMFMPGGQRLSHLSRKSFESSSSPRASNVSAKIFVPLDCTRMYMLSLLLHQQYNTIQYTNKNVAAERSPRAASTSNVEKIEVHHICPSARQHVEKELRSRSFAVGLRGECRKNRVTSALPRGNT